MNQQNMANQWTDAPPVFMTQNKIMVKKNCIRFMYGWILQVVTPSKFWTFTQLTKWKVDGNGIDRARQWSMGQRINSVSLTHHILL